MATMVLGRSDVQCRERYVNCLDPSIKNAQWTIEEDAALLEVAEAQQTGGNSIKWANVARSLPGRTDNQCLKRWRILKGIGVRGNRIPQANNNNTVDVHRETQGNDAIQGSTRRTTSNGGTAPSGAAAAGTISGAGTSRGSGPIAQGVVASIKGATTTPRRRSTSATAGGGKEEGMEPEAEKVDTATKRGRSVKRPSWFNEYSG